MVWEGAGQSPPEFGTWRDDVSPVFNLFQCWEIAKKSAFSPLP